MQGDDGITTELLLNKETVVMYGKAYRFYFNQNAHAFSGMICTQYSGHWIKIE